MPHVRHPHQAPAPRLSWRPPIAMFTPLLQLMWHHWCPQWILITHNLKVYMDWYK
ncbi:hypothetical protein HanRHA438_Chr17g0795871 [Helianthus annuus]|nr:hypothetical protein HanRHA438_Chr17g0795871 [Helianthus annuus]